LFPQLFEHVFDVGMAASPAGAVNEIVPENVPAVGLTKTVPRPVVIAQPPTVGDVIEVVPTTLPPVIVADVVPDVLHEAVAKAGVVAGVAVAVAVAAGVEDVLPPQPAAVTPSPMRSAVNAPKCECLVRTFQWSLRPYIDSREL
jgi:hypothetical protein